MAAERVTGPWLSREPETVSRELDYLLDCVRCWPPSSACL